jgi:phosphatidyl-myo-inositol dimannoside synthase
VTTLIVTTEQHFLRARGGEIYVVGSEDHAFFARYLEVFDEVLVVSRVADADALPANARRADGEGVSFWPVPDFHGVGGTLRGALPAARALDRLLARTERPLFMLRPPGAVSLLAYGAIRRRGARFAVELVTDPAESFRAEAFGSRIVAGLRRPLVRIIASMCRHALAVSYVTDRHLQSKYPARDRAQEFACPDGDLAPEVFERFADVSARLASSPERLEAVQLFMTGRMDRPFKGVDVALGALAALRERGVPTTLTIAGGGRLLPRYRSLAERLGVASSVDWLDEVSDHRALLDRLALADVFVLPTRREGLPRALLEAMALGLPCIATPVAGIPELLEPEDLVPVEDREALARAISTLAGDRTRRLRASEKNHARALAFRANDLRARRVTFHRRVAELFLEGRA